MVDLIRDDTKTKKQDLKTISFQDFLSLGIQDVAYVKKVSVGDKTSYAIHAADGTPLLVMDTLNAALIAVRHNDLEPVTLQ